MTWPLPVDRAELTRDRAYERKPTRLPLPR